MSRFNPVEIDYKNIKFFNLLVLPFVKSYFLIMIVAFALSASVFLKNSTNSENDYDAMFDSIMRDYTYPVVQICIFLMLFSFIFFSMKACSTQTIGHLMWLFRRVEWRNLVIPGLLSIFTAAFVVFAATLSAHFGDERLSISITSASRPAFFNMEARTFFTLLIGAINFSVIIPTLEEFYFRGLLLGWLTSRLNKNKSLIIVITTFSLCHFYVLLDFGIQSIISFCGIFIVGCACSFIFIKNRSLWPCVMFHGFYNIVIFVSGF